MVACHPRSKGLLFAFLSSSSAFSRTRCQRGGGELLLAIMWLYAREATNCLLRAYRRDWTRARFIQGVEAPAQHDGMTSASVFRLAPASMPTHSWHAIHYDRLAHIFCSHYTFISNIVHTLDPRSVRAGLDQGLHHHQQPAQN